MSAKISSTLCKYLFYQMIEQPSKQSSSNIELNQLSARSFIFKNNALKSKLQASFMIDQQNAKQLQQIQKKALLLKQREKKQRNYLKRLKKLYQQLQRQFEELKKVSKIAVQEKSKQIELLTIQNTQLKEEKIEWNVLKDQREILTMKNQQLQEENKALLRELQELKQKYKGLNLQFQQQSELLDKGIRQNQIQVQIQQQFNPPASLKYVQQLTQQLQQKSKEQNLSQQKLKQQQQNIKIQTQKITNCNIMLQSLLKQIKKEQKQHENNDKETINKIQQNDKEMTHKIQHNESKLVSLTDQLMRKTEQLSLMLVNINKLENDMKQKQYLIVQKNLQISKLQIKIQEQQKNMLNNLEQMENYKQEIEIYHDLEKMRDQQEKQLKQKKTKNYSKFQANLQKLLEDKMLKEHSTLYQVFAGLVKEIFNSYNQEELNTLMSSQSSGDLASEKFIEAVLRLIEKSLIKLNDYFRQKAEKDIQRIQKMVSMMKNANQIIHKNEDQYEKQRQNDMFNVSSPQRFSYMNSENGSGINPATHNHRRQQSQSSAQSKKKSIVLEEDLDSALSLAQELDQIKEQALQKQLAQLKTSQVVMVDNLNDQNGSEESRTLTDAVSQGSFSKSKFSELSQAQQQAQYNKNVKNSKMNAKLKKKTHKK